MIVVSGAGGFIGRAIVRALGSRAVPIGHRAIDRSLALGPVSAVVHAGRDPRLGSSDYRLEDDLELTMARLAARQNVPFLSLGTRKVYEPATVPLAETAPLGPVDRYGAQKLALERALETILGGLLTRLRLANIFGFEAGRSGFMGSMLGGLVRDETITFDMSAFVARDFLPVETAAAAIARIAEAPPGGIVNIGSGIPLETGRLALAVIEGRGRGRLLVCDPRSHDTFVLDVARMKRLTGIGTSQAAMLDRAREIGRQSAII
jgi:dTDP-4-dehydrorhamnose reductase/UDP-glucose 4-epimerase